MPATNRKANSERAPDRVYEALKQLILDNELPAGSFVLQEELAERLGVSRTPVREALIKLDAEGLIEVRPRHGMRVKPVSIAAMREIYELLTVLEAFAAGKVAADGAPAHVLAALEQAVSDMDDALTRNDLAAWADADDRFHKLLVAACGNTRLVATVEQVLDQVHRVRKTTLRLRPKPIGSNEAHRAVVEAIKARDSETAHRVHETHRREAGNMLVELLETLHISMA